MEGIPIWEIEARYPVGDEEYNGHFFVKAKRIMDAIDMLIEAYPGAAVFRISSSMITDILR